MFANAERTETTSCSYSCLREAQGRLEVQWNLMKDCQSDGSRPLFGAHVGHLAHYIRFDILEYSPEHLGLQIRAKLFR
jgi:hypothetical protein